jgi:hypothetical protein
VYVINFGIKNIISHNYRGYTVLVMSFVSILYPYCSRTVVLLYIRYCTLLHTVPVRKMIIRTSDDDFDYIVVVV